MDVYAWAAILAGTWGGSYLLACWIFPFRDCRVCKGTGKRRSPFDRRNHRPCWWCKGAGRRLRVGRRAWHAATDK